MRHRKSGRKLNRSRYHLKAMLKNLTCSLLNHEIIKTTLAKAKELRTVVEPLITRAKKDNIANRRLVFSRIRNNTVLVKLFTDIGPRFIDRNGGYTRILKSGSRVGDCAPVAYIELVERKTNTEVQIKKI